MKRNFKAISTYTLAAATGLVVLASCNTVTDSSGLEYMPDMYRSPAVEPYVDYGEVRGTENIESKSIQTAMTPPAGTIPYAGTNANNIAALAPYMRPAPAGADVTHGLYGWNITEDSTDHYALSAGDQNPIALTADNKDYIFAEGKRLYASNCLHCHGEKGDGNGPMKVSGAYSAQPANFTSLDIADGQAFYSTYYGKGAMGAHSMILNNKEIWTLVHYIHKFRDEDYGNNLTAGSAAPGPVEVIDLMKVDIEAQKGQSLRLGPILFKSDSDEIEEAMSPGLAPLIAFLNSNDAHVELGGYTDSNGDDAHNMELSQQRADAVKAYLVSHDISADRLEAKGYGEANLVMVGDSEIEDLSRRIELKIK